MKILSTEQVREADQYTITHEPIVSIDLMERASEKFVSWFLGRFDAKRPVAVFCGSNNNGGDGLAIARMLLHAKRNVDVYCIPSARHSGDFTTNLERLQKLVTVTMLSAEGALPHIPADAVLIEALVGSGLNGPLRGLTAQAVAYLNSLPNPKVSVDIAAGLDAEKGPAPGEVMRPGYTFSFQCPKAAFFPEEDHPFVGEFVIGDIGLSRSYLEQAKTSLFYTDREAARLLLKKRKRFSHKGDYGKALLICGSYGKMGAAVLASRAALRAGTGLLNVFVPGAGYEILQQAVPEAMVITDTKERVLSDLSALPEGFDVIGIGPGLGTEKISREAFERFIGTNRAPLVLDADALNMLSQKPSLLKLLPENTILTPHNREFERLAGPFSGDREKFRLQQEFSVMHKVVVVVKGPYTSISTPEGTLHFNSTGNPGMASGGTGDALLGIIASLSGQGYAAAHAAILGVYLHGLAGDIAAAERGEESLLASDIIDCLGKAFLELHG